MLPRLRLLVLAAVAVSAVCAPTPALAGNILGGTTRKCPLVLSSSAGGATEGPWQIGCSDGFQSTTEAVTFDSSELTAVRIDSSAENVTLKPEGAAKPTEVAAPLALSKVGSLVSSSIKTFTLEGSSGASVEIEKTSFSKMTVMRSLTIKSINVSFDGPLELPASLNELTIQRAGLVDFKVKIVKGASFNITKLDLQYNGLRRLPLAIFASKTLVSCNLQGNELLPLRLSKRKVEQLVRLVVSKRLVLGSVASFKESCTDGEAKSIQLGNGTVVVCQVPKEDDDELVQETEAVVTQVGVTVRGSSAGSNVAEAGQADSTTTTTDSTTRTVVTTKTETPSPSPKSASPQALSWTVVPAALALTATILAL